ncbi:MAG TPA: hypothetical protein VGQ99_01905 [Tepidisphaeraceae bacterium]|jgi:hypothetical protein|nr:hypothetical protein [Tepidisphaeraceae bacterium]
MGEENCNGDAPREQFKSGEDLRAWVERELGLKLPRDAVCPHHQSPFEYLAAAHFEPARDLLVWAPRGGGKTRLGAAATLLDLLYKPQCHVRILGGSLEQSLRMWEHLGPDVQRIAWPQIHKGRSTRRIDFKNGSSAAILTQSERAVRGLRVQKLRCDEVELFEPEIWEAAQLITRSRPALQLPGSDHTFSAVAGTIEAFSTMHRPGGLMSKLVEKAEKGGAKLIRWCILEVLEKCPPERECKSCPLYDDCGGIAKNKCDGFVSIDDAIAMKQRVSKETWEAEMLCRRPSVRDCVFGSFNPDIHVLENPPLFGEREIWLGIDFGYSAPFVCLWIAVCADGFHVLDEYVQEQQTMDVHIEQIRRRRHGYVKKVGCDPAGSARNEQTGASSLSLLSDAGYNVRYRKSFIVDGLEKIRAALQPAHGPARLFIHPRCRRLIEALKAYRYSDGGSELPLKDGEHDHLIDALRYFFVNCSTFGDPKHRRY